MNIPRGRDSHASDSQLIKETNSRVKRIETRMTALSIAMGVHTHSQRPEFFPATPDGDAFVLIPSKHCSLQEIVDIIPETCHGTVGVFVGSDKVAMVDALKGQHS